MIWGAANQLKMSPTVAFAVIFASLLSLSPEFGPVVKQGFFGVCWTTADGGGGKQQTTK
jgi:hypothetical protein